MAEELEKTLEEGVALKEERKTKRQFWLFLTLDIIILILIIIEIILLVTK